MLDLVSPGRSLAWDLAWQATAFLVLGGGAGLMLARIVDSRRVMSGLTPFPWRCALGSAW